MLCLLGYIVGSNLIYLIIGYFNIIVQKISIKKPCFIAWKIDENESILISILYISPTEVGKFLIYYSYLIKIYNLYDYINQNLFLS